jgi:acetyl-CoA acetyltransferase
MDAAQLYDGFSPSTYYWLEAAGFCPQGEAHAFIQDGRIALDGELPVNTFGGSLSEGRLHGMGHLAEAALQVTGRAGERQIPGAKAVCAIDGSPLLRGSGIVFTADP